MNAQGLSAVIQQLKMTNSKEDAYLDFFYNEEGSRGCHLKANKEGLELYATILLEASLEMEYRMFTEKKEIFSITKKHFIKHSNFQFAFIELLNKTKKEITPDRKEFNKSRKEKLKVYIIAGCFTFLAFLVWIFIS